MRVSIIPSDGTVTIDGVGIGGLDLSWISENIHAIIWMDTFGEVQIKDSKGLIVENKPISSLDEFDRAVQQWKMKKEEMDNPVLMPPTREQIIRMYTGALEDHYDQKAGEKGYDNRFTCALRAGYPGPFQQEGIRFAQWMDNCNYLGYQTLALVENGHIPLPSVEDFVESMPLFTWE